MEKFYSANLQGALEWHNEIGTALNGAIGSCLCYPHSLWEGTRFSVHFCKHIGNVSATFADAETDPNFVEGLCVD